MTVFCDYARPDNHDTVNYHFDADSMTVYPADHPDVVAFVAGGGTIAAYVTPPVPPVVDASHINGGKLIRFTGVVPVTILENTGLQGATRVAKGRYRVNFGTPLDTSSYSILPAYFDATNIRVIRPTARTATYAEVRVTDLAGAAQDVAEITVEIKRVVG
jgi:hypothetical protein